MSLWSQESSGEVIIQISDTTALDISQCLDIENFSQWRNQDRINGVRLSGSLSGNSLKTFTTDTAQIMWEK